jgi:glycosyltransferase involved in cell wall biosynthesis
VGNLLAAYALAHGSVPHQLVIGGRGCERFREDYGIPSNGYGRDVIFPGWIEQEDLPAVYSLADLFLYPSNLEAFPIPLTEAMACGTPVVTSCVNGLKEIAGGAAVLVDPSRPEEIAGAIRRVLGDAGLRSDLAAAGLARSAAFSWPRCARETLAILEWAALPRRVRKGRDVAASA